MLMTLANDYCPIHGIVKESAFEFSFPCRVGAAWRGKKERFVEQMFSCLKDKKTEVHSDQMRFFSHCLNALCLTSNILPTF